MENAEYTKPNPIIMTIATAKKNPHVQLLLDGATNLKAKAGGLTITHVRNNTSSPASHVS